MKYLYVYVLDMNREMVDDIFIFISEIECVYFYFIGILYKLLIIVFLIFVVIYMSCI